jgi:hypothetical protein
MGLGGLAGIADCHWIPQDNGEITYEQVEDNEPYCGIVGARASAMVLCCDALSVTYEGTVVGGQGPSGQWSVVSGQVVSGNPFAEILTEDLVVSGQEKANDTLGVVDDASKAVMPHRAEVITGLYNSFRERTANGLTIVDDRVLIFPFGRMPSPTEIPSMLLNNVRQALFTRVLASLSGFAAVPTVTGQPYMFTYAYCKGNEQAIYIVNASSDDVDTIDLQLDNPNVKSIRAYKSDTAVWEDVSFVIGGNPLSTIRNPLSTTYYPLSTTHYSLSTALPAWESVLLIFKSSEGGTNGG